MNCFKNNHAFIKNLHLITSVVFIIPVALVYGLHPAIILSELFNIKVETINLTNIFRAMMGLYLGMAAIWILGIINPKFWIAATITTIAFMGGLAFGRLVSLVFDGLPSIYFLAGLAVESALAFWGLRNVRKY